MSVLLILRRTDFQRHETARLGQLTPSSARAGTAAGKRASLPGDWGVGGASQDLIVAYNDIKGRTYAEIADVLRRAKQLAEADAQCVMT